ncbi:toxin-antitoxin system HicB family antitoxin [Nocardia sp. NPDC051981]|uniref:toxin-antitoxin system HicB family antitoxin n=1 Tax=Nocardia sp. NPDC051981 TaxID=3155417 RepID=UPI00341A0163
MPSVNVRFPDDLHAAAAAEAEAGHMSLNSAVCEAVRSWVTARAAERREDAILDRIMAEQADVLAMIRDYE